MTTPDAVIRSAARAAADSLEPIISATRQVAEAFGRRELGHAQANLSDLFRILRTLTVVTSRLAERGTPGSPGNPRVLYKRLMHTLDEFARRQQAEDWDGVAHLLTHDLDAVFAEWPATLRAFADRTFPASATGADWQAPAPGTIPEPEARS